MSHAGVDRRGRRLRLVLFAAGLLGLLTGLGWLWISLGQNPLSDVHAYYDAATRLNHGEPLYAQAVTTNEAAFYRYPPLLAILFRPLALLPFATAAMIWELFVVASLVGLIVVIRPGFYGWTLAGMLTLPIVWSLFIGQAQVPVTLFLAIGQPWSLALATNLKVLPALAAIWWVGRRDWRSLRRFAIWMVGLALLQLVLEPAGSLAFPSVFNLSQVGEVRNWSPYAVSPILWAVLVVVGMLAAWRLAPTRWGWAAAVVLSVVATPRLIFYQFMTLIAGVRAPEPAPALRPGMKATQAAAPASGISEAGS
jgi:hypothetical protein